ncbi:uncharacterized protein LAESUDRAFT_552497 [Laetiporus sulphureus 93-53]|uniref:DUF6533 domain-containing protein n=1 Tax=Laetiporus sulphureus 93-53 TaxID=1314785 RepID=A0A165FTN0_9APHY|nr:uncharacterized protein LAESUDRAFT_552497 [Laetiporus sulphureus 93-53]KZT09396.1 hypothetical protein LAESUDRAFT_552497 [Laetiporus sulphureus 93-53]
MSSGENSTSIFQNTVEGIWESNVSAFLFVGVAVLILYEYALTLSAEVASVWNGRKSLVTVLFLFNRYALLAVGVLYLLNGPIYWSTPLVSTRHFHCRWIKSLLALQFDFVEVCACPFSRQ